jgi:hypothetical protein
LSIPLLRTRVGGSLKIFQPPTLKQEEENKIVTLVSYELKNPTQENLVNLKTLP